MPILIAAIFNQEKHDMKLRSGYRAAVLMKNRLHHESGEPIEEPCHNEFTRFSQKKMFDLLFVIIGS